MARNIVVIGGGPAAVFAAIEAKKKDGAANVTLVTDEACEPYEKPPLSKAVLLGKAKPEDAPIAGPGGLAKHGVAVKLNTRCTAIDRAARQVVTTGGALPYDALVIATGSLMRELPLLPIGMPRVHYLRTEAHARAIKAGLASCKHLVVIGAGLIGLEAAASAAELGVEVTVIEFAPRIMARACDEETGAIILAEHQHHGVDFDLSASVTQVTAQLDGSIALETSDGELYVADLVLVGTGVKPDDALAAGRGPRRAGRHRRRRAVPHLRSQHLRRRRRHALRHPAGRGAAGELAARPGSRRDRRPQRRRRQRQLQHRAVVLERAVRPLHPGRRLARPGGAKDSPAAAGQERAAA